MIDNYDSFTYNLVQYFQRLDVEVLVKRNDEISCAQVKALKPKYLVVSPGPCTPNEAGISMAAIAHFAGKIPVLILNPHLDRIFKTSTINIFKM